MPNHVKNRITAPEKVIRKLLDKNGKVDFNRIIPQPKELCKDPVSARAVDIAKGSTRYKLVDLGEMELNDLVKVVKSLKCCGFAYWYDWNVENWNTKWNAYDIDSGSNGVVTFETAWSPPHPVVKVLAEKYGKDCVIRHEWADEYTGRNVGYNSYAKGVLTGGAELSHMREGYELAFDLWPGLKDCYTLNPEGNYECTEE